MKRFNYSKHLLLWFVIGSILSCTKDEPTTPKDIAVTEITLDKSTFSLNVGQKATLTATIKPSNATNKGITWSSNAEAVATVSSAGEVTGVGKGEATITATSKGDKTKKATSRATITVISGATPPSKPETLTSVIKGDAITTVVLSWTAPSDTGKAVDGTSAASITGYEITFTPIVNGIAQPIALGAEVRTSEISGLTPGETYTFTVKAKNVAGLGEGKNIQQSIASSLSLPGAPTNLVASGITTTTISLTWVAPMNKGKNVDNTPSSIKSYTLSYTDGTNPKTKKVEGIGGQAPATSITLTGLISGTEYTITVSATNTGGYTSGLTNETKASTKNIVEFNYNYTGLLTTVTQEVAGGEKIKAPTAPTRYGYIVKAWNSKADGSGTDFNFDMTTITTNITLYAKWEVITYTVTLNYNYEGAPAPTIQPVEIDKKAQAPTTAPTRSGYTFKGWNTKADGSGEVFIFSITTISSDQTLYAKWQATTQGSTMYTVSFNYNYTGSPTGIKQSIESGQKANKPTDPEGYKVTSWNSKADGSGTDFDFGTATITANRTLYAKWLYYPVNKSALQALLFTQNIAPTKIDTGRITDMSELFKNKNIFNGDISGWDTSKVTTMKSMFYKATAFNQDLSTWNTSKVTTMEFMFLGAVSFNQNLSTWNTSKVTTMKSMFSGAKVFNGDISTWGTSEVTTMALMFYKASAFNKNISGWNTSKVTTMRQMFYEASAFNGNLSTWNTSEVTTMDSMFYYAKIFNEDLSTWNTSKVTSMYNMFHGARTFSGNISRWNTSKVTTMSRMFYEAKVFNGDISKWDTSEVTTMDSMFYEASAFDQNLSGWDVSSVTQKPSFQKSPMSNKPCQWPATFRPAGTSCP